MPWHEGLILHRRPWRETSLWLEAFTLDLGKVALLAKGMRRAKGGKDGMLRPFQPLLLDWRGNGDLKTLTAVEAHQPAFSLTGTALYCGFYLNELLCRLLQRQDPHPKLYFEYLRTLSELARLGDLEGSLRRFEVRFLAEIGYGLILDHEVEYGTAIDPQARYRYDPERGPVLDPHGWLHGQTLLALQQERLDSPLKRREAKRLLRQLLDYRLEGKVLASRRLFRRSDKDPWLDRSC
ncbi:DNA repair protein RecO [Methylothermus subterraneus]